MEQTLVIVLIVAVVVIAIMYVVRKRQPGPGARQAPAQPPASKPESAAAATAGQAATAASAGGTEPTAGTAAEEPSDIDDSDAIVKLRAIELHGTATTKDEAIREAGRLLVRTGAVEESYIDSMLERERSVSTYMGNLLAIPHGTNDGMSAIRFSAISLVRYPDVLEWNGNPVKFVIGIAGADDQHFELLGRIAEVFLDESQVARLEQAATAGEVWQELVKVNG